MKNASLQIVTIEGKANPTVKLSFEGDLGIQNIEEFTVCMLQEFSKYKEFEIEIKNVENLDLAFMQLLLSFHKSIQSENKIANYSVKLPNEIQTLLEHSGYNKMKEILKIV